MLIFNKIISQNQPENAYADEKSPQVKFLTKLGLNLIISHLATKTSFESRRL